MSRISGQDTKPEMIVRKYLFQRGFRYRKNVKKLPGKPDIVLRKYKLVIFIHGCFWHGHVGCVKASIPKSNENFWENKITLNKQRDKRNVHALKKLGWRVVIIWQCKLRNKVSLEKTLSRLIKATER
jgi:DNA mismatch endonuclease (patch repair protein)